MAVNIESIGVAIETEGLAKGERAFNAAEQAANKAADAADKVGEASSRAGKGFGALESAAKQAREATSLLDKQTSGFISNLERQTATFGMSASAMARYDANMMSMTKSQRAYVEELLRTAQAQEIAAGKTDALAGMASKAVTMMAGAFSAMKVLQWIKEATMLAARYETMGVVMQVAGNNAGYTRKEMDVLEKTLTKNGISMLEARNSITQLSTANIDLSKASLLARSAQDLAVVGNVNSSEALQRMIHGIKAGQVEVLQTLGLNISFEASYKKLADQLGKNQNALTQQEKMLARTNAVTDEAARYNGIYEESMTTAGKVLNSMTRLIEDFKVKVGGTWLEAFTTVVFHQYEAMKQYNAVMDDMVGGGALEIIGHALNVVIKAGFESVAKVAGNAALAVMNVWYVIKGIGIEVGAVAAQAAAAVNRDWAAVAAIRKEAIADAAAARQHMDDFEAKMTSTGETVKKVTKMTEEQRIAAGAQSKAATEAADKESAAKKALTEFTKHYGTAQQKAALAVDEWKKKMGDAWTPEMESKILASMNKTGTAEKKHAGMLAEMAGLTADFAEKWKLLSSEYAKGSITLAQLTEAQGKLLAKQPAIKKAHDEEVKAAQAAYAAQEKTAKERNDAFVEESKAIEAAGVAMYKYLLGISQANELAQKEIDLMGVEAPLRERALEHFRVELALRNKILEIQEKKLPAQETNDLIVKAKTGATGQHAGVDMKNDLATLKDIEAYLDPAKATAFGDALKNAFGEAGNALAGLANAFQDYTKQQEELAKKQKALSILPDSKEKTKDQIGLIKEQEKIQVRAYAEMAGAAKGFFKEGTTGYKVLSAAEKAFRLYELAMAAEAMVKKIFFKEGEVAANVSLNAVKVSGEAASTAQSTALAGTEASAWGITAVVKAMASLPFPFNLAAGAATLAAVIAVGAKMMGGGGGGGTVDVAKQRQEQQGTGTVLGNESAKSESISKAIEILADNSNIALRQTSSMLFTLRSIDDGIAGMANFVARSTGLRGTSADGRALGVGSSSGALGFSKSSTDLVDTGIIIDRLADMTADLDKLIVHIPEKSGYTGVGAEGGDYVTTPGYDMTYRQAGMTGPTRSQTIGDVLGAGIQARGYSDIHKESSSWWGLSKDSSDSTVFAELNSGLKKQMVLTISALYDGVLEAGKALGKDHDAMATILQSMTLESAGLTKISLKGLSGKEVQDELQAVFSAVGDKMTELVAPQLAEFQKVGEGLFETIVRVSSGVENAQFQLERFNLVAVDYTEVVRKQGDVGAEIVRQTIVANTSLAGVRDMMSTLSGSASELADTYQSLLDVANSLTAVGISSTGLTRDLIRGAGSLDTLQSNLTSFFEDYFTDAERVTASTAQLTGEFGQLGLALPKSKAELRSVVLGIDTQTAAGQLLLGKVLKLVPAFTNLSDLMDKTASAVTDAVAAIDEALKRQMDARPGLNVERAKAMGDNSGARVLQRAIDTAGFSEAAIAAYDFNQALRDEIDLLKGVASQYTQAASQRENLEQRYLTLTGDTAALRDRELEKLDPANREFQKLIWRMEDSKTAATAAATALKTAADAERARYAQIKSNTDAAFSELERAVNAQRASAQVAVDLAQEQVNTLQSLFDMLRDEVRGMYEDVDSIVSMRGNDGRKFISNALASARHGYMPDQTQLSGAIGAVRKDMDKSLYKTAFDEHIDKLQVAGELKALQDLTGTQLSTAERQLESANNQIKELDKILENAKAELDALRGIDNGVLSIANALANLAAAMSVERATPPPPADSGSTGSDAGTSGTVAGLPGGLGSIDSLNQSLVKGWYAKNPNAVKNPSSADVDYWANRIAENGAAGTKAEFAQSVAFNTGTDPLPINSFRVGTNYVPRDMLALIHEGEEITPKAYNPAAGGKRASSDDTAAEVRLLRADMRAQAAAMAQMNSDMLKITKRWETDGMPPTRA